MRTVALIGPELYPIPPIRGGAAELFIDHTAKHLGRWRPVVISPDDPDLPRREQRGPVAYIRVPFGRLKRWLYRRYNRIFPYYDRQVAAVIEAVRPEILHVHNRPRLAVFLKERFPHLPLILHMHNVTAVLGKRERPEPGEALRLEALAACSRFVLEQEKGVLGQGTHRHYVVYNGVDPVAFRPVWEEPHQVGRQRRHWGLQDEATVLFVGKIRASKGVGVLVQAMTHVWRRLPRAVLILVGGTEFGRGRTHRQTPFFQQLRRQIAQAHGRVLVTGFIPPAAIAPMYLLGDVFVGPSQNEEGLGMVFLEAAASGLPSIATAVGGIPEVVHHGITGLLLERKDDALELADKILTLLLDKAWRRQLGRQGREMILRNFTWSHIAGQLDHIYDEVAKD